MNKLILEFNHLTCHRLYYKIKNVCLIFLAFLLTSYTYSQGIPTDFTWTSNDANSITVQDISFVGGSEGFLVIINTENVFVNRTGINGRTLSIDPGNSVYSGSGEQVVWGGGGAAPNVTITGLDSSTPYYLSIVAYSFGGTVAAAYSVNHTKAAATCGHTPDVVTGMSITPSTNKMTINSLTDPTGSVGYLIKVNTTNSFTNPNAIESSLPTADPAYSGSGEQVVYVGASTLPALDITGLNAADPTQYYFKVWSYAANCSDDKYYFETTGFTTNDLTCAPPPNGANRGLGLGGGTRDVYALNPVYTRDGVVPNTGILLYFNIENSFTNPNATYTTLPTPNSEYVGSGQQLITIGTAFSGFANVTGLIPNTTYYVKSYSYYTCEGTSYVNLTDFKERTYVTCDFSDNLPSAPVFGAISSNSMNLNSFTALVPDVGISVPDGYIIRMNTTNSFSTYTLGAVLPTDDPAYSGSGEQVIYAGNSTAPNIDITGLSANTTYYFNIVAHYPSCGVPIGVRYQEGGYTFSKSNGSATSTFISFDDITKTVGDADFDLAAVASDGSTISYQIIGQTGLRTSLSGTNNETVNLGTAGTVTIEASANGVIKQATLTINPVADGFTFTDNYFWGMSGPSDLSATVSGATGPVTYEIIGPDYGYSISGADLIWGSTWAEFVVRATDTGTGETRDALIYIENQSSTVKPLHPVVLVNDYDPDLLVLASGVLEYPLNQARVWKDNTGTLTDITYAPAIGPSPPSVEVDGSESKLVVGRLFNDAFVGSITVTATATDPNNFFYQTNSSTVDITFNIKRANGITFDAAANMVTSTYGDAPFNLVAANAAGGITYSSSDPSVISISGSTATINASGYVELTASHPGDSAHMPGSKSLFFTVNKASTSIIATTTQQFSFTGGTIDFVASATGIGSASLPLNITYRANGTSDPFTATVPSAVGVYDVEVRLSENTLVNYVDPGVTTGTLEILNQIIITGTDVAFNAPASLVYDGAEKIYTVTPDAGLSPALPQGDLELTYEGRNGTVYASSVTAPTDGGDYMVTATVKASNLDYDGSVSENFTIAPFATTINLNLPGSNLVYNGMPQGINPTADDLSSNPTVVLTTEYSISGANLFSETVPINAGTYDVRVNIAATETSYSAVEATGSYTIDQIPQAITFNPIPDVECGQTTIDLSLYASSSISATLSFASDNATVATVSGSTVTIVGAGTATITASQAGDVNTVAAIDQSQTLTIAAVQENFSVDNPTDVQVCNGIPYILPALTTGNYFSAPGGTGTAYNTGDPIASTMTLYVYGVSGVNASCTDENSFTISIDNLPVDTLADVTTVGSYTLPTLTNGNYFTAAGGTGTALNAGDPISSTQTIYIYDEDIVSGCTSESSFVVTIEIAPALHFSGDLGTTYDYLEVADDNSLDFTTGMTFEAWVNFDQVTRTTDGYDWQFLMGKSTISDAFGLMLLTDGPVGGPYLGLWHSGIGDGFSRTTSWIPTANTWYHIVVTIDGTNGTNFYVNGSNIAGGESVGGTLLANALPLRIGANAPGTATAPYPFQGIMDEVRFWNYARTEAEINSSKDVELAGTESGLVLYYNFNEGTINGDNTSLTQVTDRSTAGNNASFNSFALTGTTSNFVDGSGNGVVSALPQSITFNPLSNVTFGDTDFNLTASASSGLDVTYVSSNTSVATISGNTVAIVGAGTTTITASQAGNSNYSAAIDVAQDLTVTKADQVITFDALASTTFGVVDFDLTASSDSGLAITYTSSDETVATISGSTVTIVGAGTTTITASQSGNTNYNAAINVAQDLTVTKADQAITFAALTAVTYGDADFNLTATASSSLAVSYTSSNTAVATVSGNTVTIIGAGTTTITASQVGDANYNAATTVPQVLVVNKKDLEVTPVVTSIEYGLLLDQSGTVPLNVTGFVNGDDSSTLTPTGGGFRLEYFEGAFTGIPRNVGIYTNGARVTKEGATPYEIHPNYNYTYPYVSLEIVPREVTVTANTNQSKVYGATDPVLTYTPTPLPVNNNPTGTVYNFNAFALSGNLARAAGENAGTYAINQGALDATTANYNVNFVSDTFEITTRTIEITADAKSKTYGDVDPTLTYQITSGALQGSDTFTGSLTRATGENVGTHAIQEGTLSAGANYTLTFVSDDLTISQRAIEVTADAKTKIYGDADPTFTYTITSGSLAGSDTFTGALARVTGQAQGNYAVNQGTLSLGANYNLTFVPGNLYIDYRFIRILPTATVQKTYGNPDPVFSVPYVLNLGSLAFDDTIEVFGNFRESGEDVGNYFFRSGLSADITSTNGGGSSYQITFMFPRSTYLEILPRAIEVTADVQAKTYGDADPTLSYQVTNGALQFSDTFSGSLTRVAGEDVGTYGINQGTLSAGSNYTMTYVGNDLTIGRRAIEITADALNKQYGDADPAFTYQITNGSLVFSDAFTGNLTRVAGETIGTYAIQQGMVTAGGNYTITFVSNNLTIGKRTIEVTADAKTKIYGDADPAFTYTITSGSLVGSDAFTGTLDRAAGQAQGNYAINQGTLSLGANYNLTFVSGNLFINYRFIRVIPVAPISKTYGDADPDLTWPYIITQGSLAFDDTLETYGTFRTPGENIGRYQIRGLSARFTSTNGGESSYSITFTNGGSVSLDITARAIEVTADVQHKIYGDADPTLSYQVTNGALQFSDTFTGSLTRVTGESVGAYAINQGTLSAGRNYAISYVGDDLTIGQRAITITADDQIKVIGSADPTFTHQVTSGALQFSDTVTGSLTRVAGETLGNYAINQGTLSVNSNYNLTFVPGTLNISNKIPQIITFNSLTDRNYGDADFALTATGGASGNPITYVSSNNAVATISGNVVTIVGVGTTAITASQVGNATYADAIDVSQTLTVNKGNQTITFNALPNVTIDDADFNLTATASSGLGVTYVSSDPSVATVTGNVVSIVGLGTTTITASQAGDISWNAANDVSQSLTVVDACPFTNIASNNFQIQTASETCADKNNGSIAITAIANQNYRTTINGQVYDFTSTLTVANLPPGTYPICITIDGFSNCERCFEAVVESAALLAGKTTIVSGIVNKSVQVAIETGTGPFTVMINNEIVAEYTTKAFSVTAKDGDRVEVVSSLACEGKLSKMVGQSAIIKAYPNPTKSDVTLSIPDGRNTITVALHNALGALVKKQVYTVIDSKVNMPMSDIQAGVYFMRIDESSEVIKIIKE